ncbi:hypothetical protein R0Q57_08100 [Lactobacillus acidophilus]
MITLAMFWNNITKLPEKLNKNATIDGHFYRDIIKQRYNDPIKQTEYLYSIIESEDDLIG